jgi:hypothetical protein
MPLEDTRFRMILEDVRSRTSSGGVDTMVVAAHMAQMKLFMQRQGVEFFARQDSFGLRREFIRRTVDFNELPSRLDAIIDSFLIDGKGILYFRPSRDLYRIHYFTQDQYRSYYDESDALEELQVIYSFRVRSPFGAPAELTPQGNFPGSKSFNGFGNSQLRWVRLQIRADKIVQTVTNQQPQFETSGFNTTGGQQTVYVNTLGFIPAVEVFNNRGLNAGEGRGEFDWLMSPILEHDRMVKNIRKNLQFFGTPTLVSSRPRSDLIEPENTTGGNQRATIASNSGFVGLRSRSTRLSDPSGLGGEGGLRVPRIIANVEAADRVNYIAPDAISGDLTMYAAQYQEMIRAALGGVDDLSISSGATAYEVRSLYGRVATTAKRKCRDLYEYGFCKLFSLMIVHEERLFRDSFGAASGLVKPPPFMPEMVPPDLEARLREAKDTGEMPPNLVGLVPDGDVRIDWRYMGEIFELSSQELLQQSIICRNLQELGVSSIEALQYLFPEKTPEERAGMLTGYPFRMVEATQRSVGVFMDILRGFFQVPHPQRPDMPLAADPNLDLVPYLYRTLAFLQREMSYSGAFNDVDPASLPPILSDADQRRAERGDTTDLERQRQSFRDAFAAARNDASRNPAAGLGSGLPGSGGSPPSGTDADILAPGLGGTLGWDPAGFYSGAAGQLGTNAPAGSGSLPLGTTDPSALARAGVAGANGITLGAADLLVPSNAGVPGADLLRGSLPPVPPSPAPAAGAGGRRVRPKR